MKTKINEPPCMMNISVIPHEHRSLSQVLSKLDQAKTRLEESECEIDSLREEVTMYSSQMTYLQGQVAGEREKRRNTEMKMKVCRSFLLC